MSSERATLVEKTLQRLAMLISEKQFQQLETDRLELKPIPPSQVEWKQVYESVNAFLNTEGGILILGVREEKKPVKHYSLGGWSDVEERLRAWAGVFTDRSGNPVDVDDCIAPLQIRPLLEGQVYVLSVDKLPSERKFVFYKGAAHKRSGSGDPKIIPAEIERQEEWKAKARFAQELQPIPGTWLDDLDLEVLNDYITRLNRTVRVETRKSDLASAINLLTRKCFIQEGTVTTLGMLVCGKHPGDHLGFRCHVHGYVDVKQEIASDKQVLTDNILPLMERSYEYLLRNILVGVSAEHGGTSRPQYPDALLRETVNNALAHRDYSVNRQVILAIKPGAHISIRNPGRFAPHQLIEHRRQSPDEPAVLRILPESRPRNPKLAEILNVYQKLEARGNGMATLVNLSLENQIDLPYYLLNSQEVTLFLCAGTLLDERMERLFQAFDGYLEDKLEGGSLSESQKVVLSYLIKSEWANEHRRYTVLLTQDNNHVHELTSLERVGLIEVHPQSPAHSPIYVVDRVLLRRTYLNELRAWFGPTTAEFDALDELPKRVLDVVYRLQHFSKTKAASARQTSMSLWAAERGEYAAIREYEDFYRKVKRVFNRLEKKGFLIRQSQTRSYLLNANFRQQNLF